MKIHLLRESYHNQPSKLFPTLSACGVGKKVFRVHFLHLRPEFQLENLEKGEAGKKKLRERYVGMNVRSLTAERK